jgi:GTPase
MNNNTMKISDALLPVIAIVGRPNVGKSTLFNCFTKSRDALVADWAGVTRDRQWGEGVLHGRPFIVVDTGGIGEAAENDLDALMAGQSWQAAKDADMIVFLLDARAGLTAADEELAKRLRTLQKPMILAINKTDGLDADVAILDFHRLGLGAPSAIAASHRRGVLQLLEAALGCCHPKEEREAFDKDAGIKIAIVGKPNVGKSTLVNRMLGEDRVIVFDQPGTTRDSIFVPFVRHDKQYTLIDTAGVRRRSRVGVGVEKFSIIKTLQAVEASNVVIFVIDARENISEQDLKLLGFVLRTGKALVIAVNKWDGMSTEERTHVKETLARRLDFIDFARIHFISALHGTGVGDLFQFIEEAYLSATKPVSTSKTTKLLAAAIEKHQPPLVNGRRIKMRYAHLGGHNPPILVIHGNQLEKLPDAYRRYIVKFFRDQLKMIGTPIRLELKTSDNPFAKSKR